MGVHYGNFTFDTPSSPIPKGMSDEIHGLGFDFGLWVTLWINLDADNYQEPPAKGYLLMANADPSQAVQR